MVSRTAKQKRCFGNSLEHNIVLHVVDAIAVVAAAVDAIAVVAVAVDAVAVTDAVADSSGFSRLLSMPLLLVFPLFFSIVTVSVGGDVHAVCTCFICCIVLYCHCSC